MDIKSSRSTRRRRWASCAGSGVAALVAVTAMTTAAGAATTSRPANAPGFADGKVAAITGSSMEVQNTAQQMQTTVNWSTSTQFSKVVTETVGQLAAGDCVTATGTVSKTSKTTLAARSITITTPSSSGSCTGPLRSSANGGGAFAGGGPGAGGFRGRGPVSGTGGSGNGNGNGETRPSFPNGTFRRPGRTLASIGFASGKVTAVNGSNVSVTGVIVAPGNFVRPGNGSSSSSKSNAKSSSKANAKTTASRTTKSAASGSKSNGRSTATPSTLKTQSLKITTSTTTTVSATKSAASGDLAIGDCVSAVGPTATNGAVTATTVRITSTGGGTCAPAVGRFGGGGFFRGPGGGQQSGGGVA